MARLVVIAGAGALALVPASASASGVWRSAVHHGVLPTWARTGFSDPRPRMPHVLGRSGEIAAIVFGHPLLAPPPETRANKILWVSRRQLERGSDLRIRAQRMRGDKPVGRRGAGQASAPPGCGVLAGLVVAIGQ